MSDEAAFRPVETYRTSAERSTASLRILVVATPFPSIADPSRGVFIKEQVKAMASLPGVDVRVIAPVPWFPPIRRFSRWYTYSQYPRQETYDGLTVYHPRYPLPPKAGGFVHPQLMYPTVRRAAATLRRSGFRFDVIDSHFVYPCGVVASKLAGIFDVPFSVTGRGEDMLRFPSLPLKGRMIRRALQTAENCVALSSEIAWAMKEHGAPAERVHVIPNGVDTTLFHPRSQSECRRQLDLPRDVPVILSVGDLLELKGFHILVEAMPAILKRHPQALLVIVGGPGRHGRDYSAEIRRRVEQHGLTRQVRLVGARPHEELPRWYNAADVFALLSSREGSPNVLIEALACGTPAVGTPVGGIVDELHDGQVGVLLKERTASETARAVLQLLADPPGRSAIHEATEHRSRMAVATSAVDLLTSMCGSRCPGRPLAVSPRDGRRTG